MQGLSPKQRYIRDINEQGFAEDAAQAAAVDRLDGLYTRLLLAEESTSFAAKLKTLFGGSRAEQPKGLYFWGGVGRGKTYLMDLFFDALPFERKLRTHFHRFMRSVHQELTSLSAQKDPLQIVAARFAERYRVICFDEFFVADITDAMILANLLDALFKRGVVLVTTSNIQPSGLYENGLQRQQFLPAIALLEQHTDSVNVDGGVDYRLRTLQQSELYYFPLGEHAELSMERCFANLVPHAEAVNKDVVLEIEGREIHALFEHDDIAWFDFRELCDGPRSQNDYIELAKEYQTIFLQNVPKFAAKNDDQARRFIYLVDEFYDRNVKLVLSAEVGYNHLYAEGRLAFEFERTQSRLQEMQSQYYLASAHKG